MTQVALSTADAELNRFSRAVSVVGSSERSQFWTAADSTTAYVDYTGAGATDEATSNRTKFTFKYRYVTVGSAGGATLLGDERPNNRMRKVDLTVSWWNGEEGKPGYGELAVTATRLIRESDLREP
ncbi:MAG: hypothetical protein KC800_04870 [Candidatus Eremiobacteraeota bacterium]|nr:hypothetical protein [Candidatus Eremiobacteraeota bacterium]